MVLIKIWKWENFLSAIRINPNWWRNSIYIKKCIYILKKLFKCSGYWCDRWGDRQLNRFAITRKNFRELTIIIFALQNLQNKNYLLIFRCKTHSFTKITQLLWLFNVRYRLNTELQFFMSPSLSLCVSNTGALMVHIGFDNISSVKLSNRIHMES